MKTNKKETKNKTFIINVTIKKEDILKEYQNSLKSVQSELSTKGFRKGKTPMNVVEQQISKEHIIEEVASNLISKAYSDKVKELGLKPIIQPQVNFKNSPPSFEKDWEIELTGCELPEIELNEKFESEIKKINASKDLEENKKIDQTIDVLVKNSKVEFPAILIESDIQHHLSQLIDQANQAGTTIDQYLKDKKQTIEQYKETLKTQIEREWTINLAISKIAENQKIQVTEQEIKDLISHNPNLASNINFVNYLLIQQKVFEYLKTLK
ncbi:MAG: trigger factor [Candidatus Shapirobacteria bacterium]